MIKAEQKVKQDCIFKPRCHWKWTQNTFSFLLNLTEAGVHLLPDSVRNPLWQKERKNIKSRLRNLWQTISNSNLKYIVKTHLSILNAVLVSSSLISANSHCNISFQISLNHSYKPPLSSSCEHNISSTQS